MQSAIMGIQREVLRMSSMKVHCDMTENSNSYLIQMRLRCCLTGMPGTP